MRVTVAIRQMGHAYAHAVWAGRRRSLRSELRVRAPIPPCLIPYAQTYARQSERESDLPGIHLSLGLEATPLVCAYAEETRSPIKRLSDSENDSDRKPLWALRRLTLDKHADLLFPPYAPEQSSESAADDVCTCTVRLYHRS